MLEQINLLNFSQVDKLIAYCIVDSLDDKGFLDAELTEITASVQHLLSLMGSEEEIEDDEVAVVLKHIQRLDPVGVGSRSLAECLLVQLDHLRSEEHTSELQSRENLVCRLLLEKKKRT